MTLPPSSLLERLGAFLPEMAKANEEILSLSKSGKLEMLDANLVIADEEADESSDDESEVDEDEPGDSQFDSKGTEEDKAEVVSAEGIQGTGQDKRVVQLEFALGDFNETPIAQMERPSGESARPQGSSTGAADGGLEKNQEDEDDEEEGDEASSGGKVVAR
ncbi:unnamed protein product, partial [Discosporangium mesarthrocarpum]